ncbi:hypothetical protein GW17_00053352 [Ensete ventricosum]|nr:hypothetical protein GW17_00053352 [Ensete ventricosum]
MQRCLQARGGHLWAGCLLTRVVAHGQATGQAACKDDCPWPSPLQRQSPTVKGARGGDACGYSAHRQPFTGRLGHTQGLRQPLTMRSIVACTR